MTRTASPVDILALVGKVNLDIDNEFGSKNSLVDDIILHDDWDYNEEKFDADIAVLVLFEQVEYNSQIQPICLPHKSSNNDEYPTGEGVVVGWGKSEKTSDRYDPILNQLNQPAVSASYCYPTFPNLARAASHRMFCGGHENRGKSACLGDSGSGFYFENKSLSRWIIKGITSGALIGEDMGCNINAFSLYTNVARFVEWITKVMQKTESLDWKFIDFKCKDDSR